MALRGKMVGLVQIAARVRQDEVVAEIEGIASPGNEVVHLPATTRERPVAIEARARLDFPEDRLEHGEGGPSGAEQKTDQIAALAQGREVAIAYEAQPCALREVGDERIKGAEAVRDASRSVT